MSEHIRVHDAFLQVGHEHEIAGLEPVVMESIVIDVAQHGTGAQSVRAISNEQRLAQRVHQFNTVLLHSEIDRVD